jgi:endo-1,4-beta-mannosidase
MEDVMPIRIRYCDKPLDSQQAIGYKGVNTPSAGNPKACYTDRKPERRILCGSV